MTDLQYITIYEMWRQGLHQRADRARRCWSQGKGFQLEPWVSVPFGLLQLLERCNREVRRELAN
jgi:hypothetical protein